MASSSMCGPSNPLQNLQKHTSTDRTLQQDRLTNGSLRNQSSAHFRSQQVAPSPLLENEFEQFTGIQQNSPQLSFQQFQTSPQHAFQQPSPQLGGWASDFQRMAITSSPGSSLSRATGRAMQQQPQQAPNLNNWHQEFLLQSQQPQQRTHSPTSMMQQQQQQPGYMSNYSGGGMYAGGYNSMFSSQPIQTSAPATLAKEANFSDSEFDAMFSEAAAQMDSQFADLEAESQIHEQLKAEAEESDTALLDAAVKDHEELVARHMEEMLHKIEAEQPVQEEQIQERDQGNGDDLAKTAGVLLDTLAHNQTEKFQQSNFLALMRKIRDREVVVRGDKMVETSNPNLKDRGELPFGYGREMFEEVGREMGDIRVEDVRGDMDVGAFKMAEAHYDTCFGTKGSKGFGGGGTWEESF